MPRFTADAHHFMQGAQALCIQCPDRQNKEGKKNLVACFLSLQGDVAEFVFMETGKEKKRKN